MHLTLESSSCCTSCLSPFLWWFLFRQVWSPPALFFVQQLSFCSSWIFFHHERYLVEFFDKHTCMWCNAHSCCVSAAKAFSLCCQFAEWTPCTQSKASILISQSLQAFAVMSSHDASMAASCVVWVWCVTLHYMHSADALYQEQCTEKQQWSKDHSARVTAWSRTSAQQGTLSSACLHICKYK